MLKELLGQDDFICEDKTDFHAGILLNERLNNDGYE